MSSVDSVNRYPGGYVPSGFDSRSDVVVNRGGSTSVDELDPETRDYIARDITAGELVPDYPGLKLRDLRFVNRNFEGSEYVQVVNRHTNEELVTLPREEFNRKMGLITKNQNSTLSIYS